MNWYDDQQRVREAIEYLVRYRCVFAWSALVSDKTPCCNYREVDQMIPAGLKTALDQYYDNLSIQERRKLNAQFAFMLGERYFVRRTALIRLLSRLLCNGDPRDNKEIIKKALQNQITQRKHLLATL